MGPPTFYLEKNQEINAVNMYTSAYSERVFFEGFQQKHFFVVAGTHDLFQTPRSESWHSTFSPKDNRLFLLPRLHHVTVSHIICT